MNGGSSGKGNEGDGGKGSKGSAYGSGNGGAGFKGGGQPFSIADFRNLICPGSSSSSRRTFFTPEGSAPVLLAFYASGLDHPARLNVERSDFGNVVNGAVRANLLGGQRISMNIEFSEAYAGPLELRATTVAAGVDSEDQ
jgi:hypothetical protein